MELEDSLGYGSRVKSIAVDILEIRKSFRECIRMDNRINNLGLSGLEMEEHHGRHAKPPMISPHSELCKVAWVNHRSQLLGRNFCAGYMKHCRGR